MSEVRPLLPGGLEARWGEVDGLTLRLGIAPPLAGGRSLLLFTGRTEFIEKYEDVLPELRRRGFRVAAVEWRGQGGSDRLLADRRRGHALDFRDFQRDLGVLEALAEAELEHPWYALAHSMGTLILLEALAARPQLVARAVLAAPFLGLHAPAATRRVAPLVARLVCGLGMGRHYVPGHGDEPAAGDDPVGNVLTSDHERFRLYRQRCRENAHLLLGGVTWGWLNAALDAIARLDRPGCMEAITTPLLVLEAGNERVVDPEAAAKAAQRLPRARTLRLDGAEHELLMEREEVREVVLDAIDAFLR